jgi:hypothetical protein
MGRFACAVSGVSERRRVDDVDVRAGSAAILATINAARTISTSPTMTATDTAIRSATD